MTPPEEQLEKSDDTTSRRGFIERSIAAAYRARSLESRAGSLLSLVVICVLGTGLLAWYYGAALRRPVHAAEEARANAASRAQAEMTLPPLTLPPTPAGPRASDVSPATSAVPFRTPAGQADPQWLSAYVPTVRPPMPLSGARTSGPSNGTSPRRSSLERRLAGPAFLARNSSAAEGESGASIAFAPAPGTPPAFPESRPDPDARRAMGPPPVPEAVGATTELTKLLMPAVTPVVAAQVLPTRTLLLPKGAFIDCTLETAIDSTLPGMTTCITATDTFGADGTVVLLERGSKLVGETRGEVAQASSRVFVLWTEARTPTGVVIPLASPGTDELGRSGLPGSVNRHFFERFGAALLISIIDIGAQAAASSRGGTVVYSPTTTQQVVSEVLKDTLRIPPTVVKSQGDRIQVLVARDLDFRSVYELHAQVHGR